MIAGVPSGVINFALLCVVGTLHTGLITGECNVSGVIFVLFSMYSRRHKNGDVLFRRNGTPVLRFPFYHLYTTVVFPFRSSSVQLLALA